MLTWSNLDWQGMFVPSQPILETVLRGTATYLGIQRSKRHKSGVAVRFPRMALWRSDKQPEDADSLQVLQQLLASVDREGNRERPAS